MHIDATTTMVIVITLTVPTVTGTAITPMAMPVSGLLEFNSNTEIEVHKYDAG